MKSKLKKFFVESDVNKRVQWAENGKVWCLDWKHIKNVSGTRRRVFCGQIDPILGENELPLRPILDLSMDLVMCLSIW